jgi:hypothetical protein
MSQEQLGGPFVVLGDLCVSRRVGRQPKDIQSEALSHRIDWEARKSLNCERLQETNNICSLGGLEGLRA